MMMPQAWPATPYRDFGVGSAGAPRLWEAPAAGVFTEKVPWPRDYFTPKSSLKVWSSKALDWLKLSVFSTMAPGLRAKPLGVPK